MYDARIAFNIVTYKNFKVMTETIEQYGPGLEPPTYHEVRIPSFKQAVDSTEKTMEDHKEESARSGCSIMSNRWTDKREKTYYLLVKCLRGAMLLCL